MSPDVELTPEEHLHAAVRQAILDTSPAGQDSDELVTLQATAAVNAMLALGWVHRAGWEYAVKRGDVTEEAGFNTVSQAQAWVEAHAGAFEIVRRPVGVWGPA